MLLRPRQSSTTTISRRPLLTAVLCFVNVVPAPQSVVPQIFLRPSSEPPHDKQRVIVSEASFHGFDRGLPNYSGGCRSHRVKKRRGTRMLIKRLPSLALPNNHTKPLAAFECSVRTRDHIAEYPGTIWQHLKIDSSANHGASQSRLLLVFGLAHLTPPSARTVHRSRSPWLPM